ncbi:MAG: glycoside hydrolase family 127 protein, partial [Tepidisphaeraceae bacterium]
KRIKSDPRVKANVGRVALQRGPIVYCAEAVDNNGSVVNLFLPASAELKAEHRADLLGGVTVLTAKAMAKVAAEAAPKEVDFTAIPYYAWDHREAGEMAVWLAEDPALAKAPSAPTIASKSKASASHVGGSGNLTALNDQEAPQSSRSGPHFAFWPHKGVKGGTAEWIQYDFAKPERVAASEIYWFDDVPGGGCKTPASWKLLYKVGNEWKPVEVTSGDYDTAKDCFHRVEFKPVTTPALRVEVQLQEGFSAGVMEWRVLPPGD